jgi:hypothetical protein
MVFGFFRGDVAFHRLEPKLFSGRLRGLDVTFRGHTENFGFGICLGAPISTPLASSKPSRVLRVTIRLSAGEVITDLAENDAGLVAVISDAEDGGTFALAHGTQCDAGDLPAPAVKQYSGVDDDRAGDQVLAAATAADDPQLFYALARRLTFGHLLEEGTSWSFSGCPWAALLGSCASCPTSHLRRSSRRKCRSWRR